MKFFRFREKLLLFGLLPALAGCPAKVESYFSNFRPTMASPIGVVLTAYYAFYTDDFNLYESTLAIEELSFSPAQTLKLRSELNREMRTRESFVALRKELRQASIDPRSDIRIRHEQCLGFQTPEETNNNHNPLCVQMFYVVDLLEDGLDVSIRPDRVAPKLSLMVFCDLFPEREDGAAIAEEGDKDFNELPLYDECRIFSRLPATQTK